MILFFSKTKEEGWPTEGRLTFEKVYLYYSKAEQPFLKNLNFTISPSEKVSDMLNLQTYNSNNFKEQNELAG